MIPTNISLRNWKDISVKVPDKEDAAELAPLLVALSVWLFTSDNKRKTLSILLPIAAALVAWLILKGLVYVPR